MTIVFAGDPHGNFSPILRACLARHPGILVLLGDLDCPRPLPEIFAPVLDRGWQLHWILGNHDCETESAYHNLVTAHPLGDLGLRVTDLNGLRVAGLPGVFKPSVWSPRAEDGSNRIDPPRFQDRAAFLAAQPTSRLWRGGMPLWHRDTIFPEDARHLSEQRFDVLVSHEAPSCHKHGFPVIDGIAEAAGARLIVHGHHHESYDAVLPNGIAVRGLGLAECWEMGG